jgi:tetratricopeptide (TPR) repeat protein
VSIVTQGASWANGRAAAPAIAAHLALATLAAFASSAAIATEPEAASDTPLFDYAVAQPTYTQPFNEFVRKQIASIEAEMARHPPPPDEDCAHTLGASRFARQYSDLGVARSNAGEYEEAIATLQKAVACAPRVSAYHGQLAAELMHVGRLADARAASQRGLALVENPSATGALDSMLMQLDFIDERWADTVARLRAMIATESDDERAAYYQCFLWLAQRRAGVRQPELVKRAAYEEWPATLLRMLEGKATEADVLDEVKDQKNEQRRREVLVEALYYVGQLRLANGEPETARHYFAAAVNLKVLYFIEHHMALAELTKMRERSAAAPSATSNR